jgi:TonB-dependent receptor
MVTMPFHQQGGYNDQNNDWNNYKLNGNISNRFFKDKLGIDFNISSERVNRSTQMLAANYVIETASAPEGEFEPMYLNDISLIDVSNIKHMNSGTLVIDYRFSPKSSIQFSNFFTYNPGEALTINKNFSPLFGIVQYSVNQGAGNSSLYSGSVLGEHVLGKVEIDYGVSYSLSDYYGSSRNFMIPNFKGFDSEAGLRESRSLPLSDIINMANDEPTEENLKNFGLGEPGTDGEDKLNEKQYEAHLNIKMPFRLTDYISGNVKIGGQYKNMSRSRNYDYRGYGGPPFHKLISGIQNTNDGKDWALDWVTLNEKNAVSMVDMVGGQKGEFLQGGYNFGWYPDINKLNEIYYWWQDLINYYRDLGGDAWRPVFGQLRMMGYYDLRSSVANDNKLDEDYYAGYVMSEIKIGNRIHFIPGFRYENLEDHLYGWFVKRQVDEGLVIPGHDTTATQQNSYFFPMVHLKIKLLKWANLQLSYTETIHRPVYNSIIPFEYVDNALMPYSYEAGNPLLKPESWTNFDAMLSFYSNKIGLLSINGFYKTVKDKIWQRSWTRIPGDDPVPYFPENAQVVVSSWYNHQYPVYVKGFEFEWQTNFWYLPKPFSFFTLTMNYSILKNETIYPYSEIRIIPVDTIRGRVIFEKIRIDSTYRGMMINQPKAIGNISLGFSYKKFDIWLSYQYMGEILTSKANMQEYDKFKGKFSRWGLQAKLELPVKGMELLFNVANLNNIQEQQYFKGDSRPANLENYGWTADLGFRYAF